MSANIISNFFIGLQIHVKAIFMSYNAFYIVRYNFFVLLYITSTSLLLKASAIMPSLYFATLLSYVMIIKLL